MKEIKECLSSDGEVLDYNRYYVIQAKLIKILTSSLEKWKGIKAKALIIKALFSRKTKIIPTTIDREDYGADVGYIISIQI